MMCQNERQVQQHSKYVRGEVQHKMLYDEKVCMTTQREFRRGYIEIEQWCRKERLMVVQQVYEWFQMRGAQRWRGQ